MGPCFQRPGFEKKGMLGQRTETFDRQVSFSSACNSPAYLLGADVFCVDMHCGIRCISCRSAWELDDVLLYTWVHVQRYIYVHNNIMYVCIYVFIRCCFL